MSAVLLQIQVLPFPSVNATQRRVQCCVEALCEPTQVNSQLRQAQRWSRFPIERHAYKAYTRDIYVKFRTEFQMIGQYDVRPAGINFYYLEPNTEEVVG